VEIKAELLKPYTEEERSDFIVEQNHRNGYLIEEQDNKIIAYIIPPTFDELKQHKRDEIAADRFNYETGGITVDGAEIKTDRESVALLKGAYDEACDNPNYTVNWKAANGFVTLNAEQIITIYQRVKAHVQSSFDAEMMINQQIDAATTEEQLNEIVWVDPN